MTAELTTGLEGREWTASVNGTELRVEEVGSGAQAVVFAPNPFTNRALYDAPVAALSGDYRCLRYDHRGQGESGFGTTQPSPDLLGTEGSTRTRSRSWTSWASRAATGSGHRSVGWLASVWRRATRS